MHRFVLACLFVAGCSSAELVKAPPYDAGPQDVVSEAGVKDSGGGDAATDAGADAAVDTGAPADTGTDANATDAADASAD
jgi:hypothetical protein